MIKIRVVTAMDVEELTDLIVASREFLAPFEPRREDSYYDLDFQKKLMTAKLADHEQGSEVPFVVLDEDKIIGQLVLDRIELGPYQSCEIGYWIAEEACGKGCATEAVAQAIDFACEELGLKRIMAATLPSNIPSIRVLEKNGFTKIGEAKNYMEIAGERRDHILYEYTYTGE